MPPDILTLNFPLCCTRQVCREDWLRALGSVRPSNERADVDASGSSLGPAASALASTKRVALSSSIRPLISATVDRVAGVLTRMLAAEHDRFSTSGVLKSVVVGDWTKSMLLLTGDIPECTMNAVWHRLESVQVGKGVQRC